MRQLSRIIRRTHMYAALFLFPWMLMYALSTAAMNHRAAFNASPGAGPTYERERQFVFEATLPQNTELRTMSRLVLTAAGLDGAHGVNRRSDGAVVITRNDLLRPRRVTYNPADRIVTVEKLQQRPNAVLERFHRRRGYATGYGLDTAWAVTVDAVIIAMVFWVLSGLWMWWEMKATRLWGATAILGGAGLFTFYLLTL